MVGASKCKNGRVTVKDQEGSTSIRFLFLYETRNGDVTPTYSPYTSVSGFV
jgi:hypothetical protein